jgi:hypothetical protein
MPKVKVSNEDAQAALNWVELYGSGLMARKALGDHLPPRQTIDGRADLAKLRGLRPTVKRDAPRIHTSERLGRMHIVIPDVQAKPGVKLDHLTWVGNYIAEKKPDVVVCIGDFADMESLSKYDFGTVRGENRRLKRDLDAARKAMDLLMAPIKAVPDYRPELHLTMGNHEERLDRFANTSPFLDEVVGTHMLRYEDWGWKVHPFLKPVIVDGVEYAHYFISGDMGRPVSSANAMRTKRARSAIMGHNQRTDVAFDPLSHQWYIFCGLCCLHDEDYLGPQGNNHRRQILVLHEVEDGRFDPMFVSLRFLEKAYS